MHNADIHMPWLGRTLAVVESTDPTYLGRSGLVIEETKHTLVLSENDGELILPKREIRFTLDGAEMLIDGRDVQQRSEDRIHRRINRS